MVADRAGVLNYAESFIGRPYSWAGDDPISGFDCSGLIVEVYKAFGILGPNDDYTANGLYTLLFPYPRQGDPEPGDLAFWFSGDRATHIEICCNSWQTIGAAGTGSPRYNVKKEAQKLATLVPVLNLLLLDDDGEPQKNLYTWILERVLSLRQAEQDAGYIRKRPLSHRPGYTILNPFGALENA